MDHTIRGVSSAQYRHAAIEFYKLATKIRDASTQDCYEHQPCPIVEVDLSGLDRVELDHSGVYLIFSRAIAIYTGVASNPGQALDHHV